jgi:predicted N-acetyltransferase YhbS
MCTSPFKKALQPMYHLTIETPEDWWEVEALYDLCFAPGREAISSYRLRDNALPQVELCHVARDAEGILAGAIRYWPVRVGDHKALLLGPVAVHPTRQGEGLGRELIETTLEIAARLHWSRVMLVGDATYYNKFGFACLDRVVMPPPINPKRVLGRAVEPNAWNGVMGKVIRLD